jgi:uncharacterized protein (TIGR03437 family)
MLYRLLAALLFCAVCGAAQIRITWIGQSCFVIQTPDGSKTVITDPPVASVGYTLPTTPADVVTVSHDHTDHNYTAGVKGSFTQVNGRSVTARQEVTAAGLPFILIPGFHDNTNGSQRGQNTMMRWTQNGVAIAHLGDVGQDSLTTAQVADLQSLDVMIIPAGGFYTIDAQKAATFIAQLKPRAAILMHFRTPLGGPAQLVTFPAVVAPFLDVVYAPSPMLIDKSTLDAAAAPAVYVMEPAAEAAAVNGASFAAGQPVAPGSLASLFGSFTGSVTASASSLPLSRKLGETELLVANSAVPLLYVSPLQINFQVPRQTATSQVLVEARVAGKTIARATITVIPTAPGLFAVLNQDSKPNSATNPAKRGQVLQIYATGQGEVSPAVEDGAAPAADKLSVTAATPTVTIGGKSAKVQFSGLAPGFVGVWQLNVTIPDDAPTGNTVPLAVTWALTSNTLQIAITQ